MEEYTVPSERFSTLYCSNEHYNILGLQNNNLGLAKFDTTREHKTNLTRFLWVWIEYNCVCGIFVLTRLTRLINGSYCVDMPNTNLT